MAQVNWITMIAALAVVDAVVAVGAGARPALTVGARLTPTAMATPTIKWFNDVMLVDKKACGILVETSISGEQLDYAIVGIGLNINTDFSTAPDDVRTRATSLREAWAMQESIDQQVVLQALLTHLDQRYTALEHSRQSPTPEYAARLNTLGKWVRLQTGDEIVEGLAEGVDHIGGLCVRTTQGLRVIHFGHVLSAMPS